MNKLKKIIVVIIYVVIICLIILFSKDYIIRQYFIRKIESVDYDEYIITTSYNGKKKEIAYYTDDFGMVRTYDENEILRDTIMIYDYTKNVQYEYFITEGRKEIVKSQNDFNSFLNLNNYRLLNFLKSEDGNKRKCSYKGIGKINNKLCYILEFEEIGTYKTIIYLNKELLYTVREDYIEIDMKKDNENIDFKHTVFDYDLDFDLKQKNLFKTYSY